MSEYDYEVDVLVAGSGNGGLSAAVAAACAGAKVLVVEMGSVTGGSSAMSGGGIAIEGATTYDEYIENTHGMHDATFSRAYFDNFTEYTSWLKQIGAAVWSPPPPALNVWMGSDPDGASEPQCRDYFDSLERVLRAHGGEILLKTRARKLLTDDRGRITGLRARRWATSPLETDGPEITIRAPNVVLSLGGFQNNKELCVKYIGPEADLISAVGCPYDRGEGMLIAQEVGAALSGSMSGIYGTFMSAYPARRPLESMEVWERSTEADKTEMFNLLWFNTPPGFIAVNMNGKRFIDEIEIRYRVIQAAAQQPRAMGIMLFDADMYAQVADMLMLAPGTGATEREKFASRKKLEGDVLLQADTIEGLADELAKLGPHRTYRATC